jgi:DNA-binding MarR family transcriptional regulator
MPALLLSKYLPYRLTVLATRVARTFASKHIDRQGVSIPEWRVIMTLSHLGDVSPGDIRGFAEMDKAKINRATTRLIAAGLVRSVPDRADGRRCILSLTESGRRLHAETVPIALHMEKELLSVLDRTERRALDQILAKLDAKIREMAEPHPTHPRSTPE